MKDYRIKILQARKRLGIKSISAPSMEEAEHFLIGVLKDYYNPKSFRVVGVDKSSAERKLILLCDGIKISVRIQAME